MDELKQRYEREWAGKAALALSELADVCSYTCPTDRLQVQREGMHCQIPKGQCKLLPGPSAERGTLQVEVRSKPGVLCSTIGLSLPFYLVQGMQACYVASCLCT